MKKSTDFLFAFSFRSLIVFFFALIIVFHFSNCSNNVKRSFYELPSLIEKEKKQALETQNKKLNRNIGQSPKSTFAKSCGNYKNYIPDTLRLNHFPIRTIRINIHVMNASDSSQNFKEAEARQYIGAILDQSNNNLDNNKRMWLTTPRGQVFRPLPTRYRYELYPSNRDAFHFHYDDSLYYYVSRGKQLNLYDQKVLNKYNVGGDSVINLFFMPHHPDSQKVKNYVSSGGGIALGNSLKVGGIFENRLEAPSNFNGLINHEIGHILGLGHAWHSDGCDDTPEHKQNCWAWSPDPPCNADAYNNVMEYNAEQNAWSPCQIGRIHQNLATESHAARRALRPDWCFLDENQAIEIADSVDWLGAKDLNGPLKIKRGGRLKIGCRVSMPPDSKIIIEAGGVLILDNATLHQACEKTWLGIEIESKKKEKGRVEIIGATVLEDIKRAEKRSFWSNKSLFRPKS